MISLLKIFRIQKFDSINSNSAYLDFTLFFNKATKEEVINSACKCLLFTHNLRKYEQNFTIIFLFEIVKFPCVPISISLNSTH